MAIDLQVIFRTYSVEAEVIFIGNSLGPLFDLFVGGQVMPCLAPSVIFQAPSPIVCFGCDGFGVTILLTIHPGLGYCYRCAVFDRHGVCSVAASRTVRRRRSSDE